MRTPGSKSTSMTVVPRDCSVEEHDGHLCLCKIPLLAYEMSSVREEGQKSEALGQTDPNIGTEKENCLGTVAQCC